MRGGASGVGAVHALCSEGKPSVDRAPPRLSSLVRRLLPMAEATLHAAFRTAWDLMALFWKSLEEVTWLGEPGQTSTQSVGLSRINSSPWLPFRLDLLVCLRLRPGPDWPWVIPRS